MRFFDCLKRFMTLVLVAMVMVACQPDTPENPITEKYLKVYGNVFEFEALGGYTTVTWEVLEREVSRAEDSEVVVATESEWIILSDYEEPNSVRVDVDENLGGAREGKVTFTYGTQVEHVVIKQAGAGEEPEPSAAPFSIAVQEVHAASAITQVVPEDVEMYYVMFLDEVSYLQYNGITTAEQLWEDDFEAFERGALNENMNLKEYMVEKSIVFQGTQRVQWNSVRPGINSVLYVYGVQFSEDGASYEPITDIAWTTIKPEYAPLQDVTFEVSASVKGAEVELDIQTDWDGYYLVKIVDANDELYVGEGVTFDDDYMALIADEWVANLSSNLAGGHPIENILEQVCYKGDKVIATSLDSYVLYSALVYPVAEYDGFVQVVGKPSYVNFSTEEVGKSDMDIAIEVTNCYVRVTDLKITPSNPDESWILLITPTAYLPTNYDDQTLLDYALGEFSYYTYEFKGEITTHLNTLYPNTEYIVVAFGYSGGIVTTDVCSKTFRTQKEGQCELEVTDVVVGGPYRPTDLYNYDPETFKYYTKPYYYDSVQFIDT